MIETHFTQKITVFKIQTMDRLNRQPEERKQQTSRNLKKKQKKNNLHLKNMRHFLLEFIVLIVIFCKFSVIREIDEHFAFL